MWWAIWALFLLFLLLAPLTWGMGYRRWGPPRFYYWRRHQDLDYWNWRADFVYVVFVLLAFWLLLLVLL